MIGLHSTCQCTMLRVLYCTLAIVPLVLGTTPHVVTSQGEIVGRVLKSRNGRDYISYTGIPFAKPPVGPLRFMAPEPADPWSGVLEATRTSPMCFQVDMFGQRYDGQEDCLYLDVYVPQVEHNTSLPVIFSIYGGGFMYGSTGSAEASNYFMDEDIVLVEPNYRVNSLGFLSFEDDTVPGNMGLKDQALALEWVSREISSFGGDPNLITVIGVSAGGVSSHVICSAPRTTGLIKGCISQSGVGWAMWAFQAPGAARSKALALSEAVGCTGQLLQCLQSKTVQEIATIPPEVSQDLPWSPVLEPTTAAGALITEWPTGAKNFPWITGVTHDEGLLTTGIYEYQIKTQEQTQKYIENIDLTITEELKLQNRTEVRDVLKKIKERFFRKDIEPLVAIRNFYTEMMFVYPALKALKYHTGPKYFYHFNYGGGPTAMNPHNISAVEHGAETPYFFEEKFKYIPNGWPSSKDVEVSKLLVKLWANFARDQSPSSQSFWPTFGNGNYLNIAKSGIEQDKFTLFHDILNFWKDL